MRFHAALFSMLGQQVSCVEHDSATSRCLYPIFQTQSLSVDVALAHWPALEIEFAKPYSDFTMAWFPMGKAAVAVFSFKGELRAYCVLASGRSSDATAARFVGQVLEWSQSRGEERHLAVCSPSGRPRRTLGTREDRRLGCCAHASPFPCGAVLRGAGSD